MSARCLVPFLLAGLLAVGGCTSIWGGFDDPEGELSLVGEPFEGCTGGRAYFFGTARNTGQLEVRNSTAIVDVFGGGGSFLGRFQAPVAAGVESAEGVVDGEIVSVDVVNTTLPVDETGTFNIQTGVGCGAAARTEYSFTFTVAVFEDL